MKTSVLPNRVQEILALTKDGHWSHFFPGAHLGDRHIEAYLGPTNSGKTWQAIQQLKAVRRPYKGVYLAPLRLLALEVWEELHSQGVRASLITGEEQEIDPEAVIVCSTIEMLNAEESYQVAVIDEMQMVVDPQRGWAWTRALFELNTDKLLVLGSPSVAPLLKQFAESTGDELTVLETKRYTRLQATAKPIAPKAVKPGTLFVVFSRNSVILWGDFFRKKGHSVAQIYGAMPPEVRRAEARRFREKEADIMVATDAVAMGLNLPAHTVILAEDSKYDGVSRSKVHPSLVRQIAGRAGRYGLHEAGLVAGLDIPCHKGVVQALAGTDTDISFPEPYVAPSHAWIDLVMEVYPDTRVEELLQAWQHLISGSKWFRAGDAEEAMQKISLIGQIQAFRDLSVHEQLQILSAPVELRDVHLKYYKRIVQAIVLDKPLAAPGLTKNESMRTEELESLYKQIILYRWFHYRYPEALPEIKAVIRLQDILVSQIIAQVKRGLRRYCRICGMVLPGQSRYGICQECFSRTNW